MSLLKTLIVPDAHIPYEDKRAWRVMIRAATAFKPDLLIVIGDLADCFSVSSHSKDPVRARRLPAEIAAVNARLDELDGLGARRQIFIEGNHEDRLRRYLCDKAPELFGIVDIPKLFRLKARGWQYVPYKSYTRVGKLYLTHDVDTAGRYATFKALDTFQHSNVTGHSHRMQYIVEGNAVGEFKLSAQFGWLGDRRRIDYMQQVKVNKDSALGFGLGYIDERSGIAYLTPVPIVSYKACVEGTIYRA